MGQINYEQDINSCLAEHKHRERKGVAATRPWLTHVMLVGELKGEGFLFFSRHNLISLKQIANGNCLISARLAGQTH